MGGVSWEVQLPADMKAPQYKVKNPEYLGDDDMKLKLDGTFPKFSSVDSYIKNNVATKVLEKKPLGEAFLIVAEVPKYNAGKFLMTGMVPGKTIGWYCSGADKREAEIRAMCESVKFSRK